MNKKRSGWLACGWGWFGWFSFVRKIVNMPPTYTAYSSNRDWRQNCVNFNVSFLLFFGCIVKPTEESTFEMQRGELITAKWYTGISNSANENYYVTIHTFHSCREWLQHTIGSKCTAYTPKTTRDNIKLITKWIEFLHKSLPSFFFLRVLHITTTIYCFPRP